MGSKTWLVDNGASKHMTRYKEILLDFKTKSFAKQVELGDDECYKIEGVDSISFRLESGARLHVVEVLYVTGLILEVSQQRHGEIFLAQRKYTEDVLKRFGMVDCKSMSTPMVINMRELHDSDTGSNLVDPTMYR
jgi:hypothetical protein